MPLSDLTAEGFPELTKEQFIERFFDGKADTAVWVVRFKFEPLPELPAASSDNCQQQQQQKLPEPAPLNVLPATSMAKLQPSHQSEPEVATVEAIAQSHSLEQEQPSASLRQFEFYCTVPAGK